MFGKIRIVLHQARRDQSFIITKLVPCLDALGSRRKFSISGHSAGFLLAFQSLFPKLVPALIKLPFVASSEALGNLMRSMGRSICYVGEERAVRCARLLLADPRYRPVCYIITQVIAFFRFPRRIDPGRSVIQDGRELVHLAAEKPVELFKAAAGWPSVERAGNALLPTGRLVALAEIACVVAVES